MIVTAGKHYGVTITTCVRADPESKGGAESTVKLAKADIVPTDHNLLDDYDTWAELIAACEAFMDKVHTRDHRVTRRPLVEMLAEEQRKLHRLPERPFTFVLGESRRVSRSSTRRRVLSVDCRLDRGLAHAHRQGPRRPGDGSTLTGRAPTD